MGWLFAKPEIMSYESQWRFSILKVRYRTKQGYLREYISFLWSRDDGICGRAAPVHTFDYLCRGAVEICSLQKFQSLRQTIAGLPGVFELQHQIKNHVLGNMNACIELQGVKELTYAVI